MADEPAPITLDPADYWELQARSERQRSCELALAQAQEARQLLLRRLAERYGLDLTREYRLEEASRRLLPT